MNAIDKGFGVLALYGVHLSVGSHEFGNGAVCKQHKLFDKPVGLATDFLVNPQRFAVRVAFDLHLRAVKIDCAISAALCL